MMSETTLWTNPSPDSTQSQGNIALSDSIANYDFIKIYYRYGTTSSMNTSCLMSVSNFKSIATNPNVMLSAGIMGATMAASDVRHIKYVDNTTCFITSTLSGDSRWCIITKVSGVKYVSSGGSVSLSLLAKVDSYSTWAATPWASANPATISLSDTAKYALVVLGLQSSYSTAGFTLEVTSGATQVGTCIATGQRTAGYTQTIALLIKDVSASISVKIAGNTNSTPVFSVWKLA